MNFKHIQHYATAAICALLFGITFLLGTMPARAQGKVFTLNEMRSIYQGKDVEKLRELAFSEVPADVPKSVVDIYYEAMMSAALKVGANGQTEILLRKWIAAGTGAYTPKIILFDLLKSSTSSSIEETLTLGEDLMHNAKSIDNKITTRAQISDLYLTIGDFKKSDDVLNEAEITVKQELPTLGLPGARLFWTPYVKARYLKSRCVQQMQLHKYKQALENCQQAVAAQNDAAQYKHHASTHFQAVIGSIQVETQTYLMKIYIGMGQLYDAELALKKAHDLLSTNGGLSSEKYRLASARGWLAIAKRDIFELNTFVKNITNFYDQAQLNAQALSSIYVRNQIQTILVMEEKWQDAVVYFKSSDALMANSDKKLQAVASNTIVRSLAYLMAEQPSLALKALEGATKNALTFLGQNHPRSAMLQGLTGVALYESDASKSKQALQLLEASVQAFVSADNLSNDYFNQAERPFARKIIFEKYIELAVLSRDPLYVGRALGIADALRVNSTQQAMNDAAVRSSATTPQLAELVRRDQDAKNELKNLYEFIAARSGDIENKRLEGVLGQMKVRIAELERSRAALSTDITKQFPEYSKLTNPAPPTLTEIATKLKPDEALLTLLPTDKSVYVWAISQGADGAVNQAFTKVDLDKAQLAALVKRLRSTLDVAGQSASRMPAFDSAAAQELYQKLLAPVQSGLQGKTSLIVAAGGVLGQIPFGVLQTADKDSWLIKQAAITHVPSVAAWLSMRALPHKTADLPMLAWGDPLFNVALASNAAKGAASDVRKVNLTRANTAVDLEKEDPRSALKYADIPALPETRDELLAIAKTLGADAAKDIILGSQATRESVLAANKNGSLAKRRVVAFATHGLMAGDLPNLTQPALAMAGTKDDATNVLAPLLTLEDVLTLKLNADWVVLSACNTAAADGKAEEALSGLARGFFYAGSRSLLVTHWAVDSDSAVTLTTETFKHYQNNPTAQKAESLRQAMLTVLADPKTAHPAYWAPYALVGDGAR